jgi:hypothetical protein
MNTQKVRADQIAHKLEQLHRVDAFFTQVKNGPTFTSNNLLILDAVALKKSWSKPCITGYEIKVDRGDFIRDEKWPYYLQYCNKFYFACPTGLIDPDELSKDIGLIYYNPEKQCISTKRKALMKTIDLPTDMFYYIIMNQIGSDKHPFFGSRREFFEALVQDKEDCRMLARYVHKKTGDKIREAEKRTEEAERKAVRLERQAEEYEAVKSILVSCGINTNRWSWREDLEKLLKSGMPLGTERNIESAIENLQRLLDSIKQRKVSA